MSLLAVQLRRHASLRVIDRDTVWARHPGVTVRGTRVVPAAHVDPPSVFINPVKNAYNDRLLPDGRTIEFHPSSNDLVNGKLQQLVGRQATLYAFLGQNDYRTGRVVVETRAAARGVFYLRIVPPSPPAQGLAGPSDPLPRRWADMSDSD